MENIKRSKLLVHPVESGNVSWKINDVNIRKKTTNHPLEFSEQYYTDLQRNNNMTILEKTQGLHASLRIMAEQKIANSMNRLPGLGTFNLMSELLTGEIDDINTFNTRDNGEHIHSIIDKTI